MIYRFFKNYLSTIFLFGILLGSVHHHNDLKLHSDCSICILHSNIHHSDTPSEAIILTQLDIYKEQILLNLFIIHKTTPHSTLQARAPPLLS